MMFLQDKINYSFKKKYVIYIQMGLVSVVMCVTVNVSSYGYQLPNFLF